MKILAAIAVAAALSTTSTAAFAQRASSAPAPQAPSAATAPSAPPAEPEAEYTVRNVNGRQVYVLGGTGIVYGNVQRPYAFAVTGRSPLGYTALEDARSFVPAVTSAVRATPF